MPSLKEYNAKLDSLRNTRKMTKTMKMVSASKLYKTMELQRNVSAYEERLHAMIQRLCSSLDQTQHPLLLPRPEIKNVLVLLVTSDKGLCGGFNNNIIKHVAQWIASPARKEQTIHMACCGRRGYLFYRRRLNVVSYYEDATHHPSYPIAEQIGKDIRDGFLSGAYDEVHIAFNLFQNAISQRPVIMKLLPFEEVDFNLELAGIYHNYILEPDRDLLVDRLLTMAVDYEVYYSLVENAAGENGARMTAMDSATTNAEKMISLNTLLRNRARQAAITTELIEIISGAEALKA
ncbi:MAG TPA: ATP synthase F1 subunit gamma [Kiritimatiellia bacterium]|nr:ATP synthase F1 subunit gamma [Kiritimatiellia bacterium]